MIDTHPMNSRRSCREAALQALYQCDALGDFSLESAELFFAHFVARALQESDEERVTVGDEIFCRELVTGVISNLENIDTQIGLACERWSVPRMGRVDRNVIRVAAYEMIFLEEIPHKVSINEAVDIAKDFCGDDAPNFINGVLDKLSALLSATET